jgi:hypothetical protein
MEITYARENKEEEASRWETPWYAKTDIIYFRLEEGLVLEESDVCFEGRFGALSAIFWVLRSETLVYEPAGLLQTSCTDSRV